MLMKNEHARLRTSVPYPRWLAGGLCGLLAASAVADTKLITSGSPARVLVPASDALGGTWRNVTFNDSTWLAGTNGIGYEVQAGAYSASVIADSRGDWSTAGQQGENRWVNGYYDLTADTDRAYQVGDFQPFPRADGPWDDDNFWDGGSWNWNPDNVPWDTIGQSAVHPNGENSGGVEHWVMRRWHSTAAGAITLRFHVRKDNASGGGVTGKIFKNGTELFSRAIAGSDTTGYEVYVNTAATPTDVFDFALTPVGSSGDAGDGSDGSVMTATVLSGTVAPPPPPVTPTAVADSSSDWVEGSQGANGWFYGFYNYTADADQSYDPNVDFNTTDASWTFAGGAWQLGEPGNAGANPPWDTIGQTDWHPNGDNQPQGVHWMIRRWVSDVDGDLHARVQFKKSNVGGGNGTTLHVLHNGFEVYAKTVASNDGVGVDTFVAIPGVLIGDKIEFALDPKGTDGLLGDGADGSYLLATIRTGPVPQTELANSVSDWVTGAQGEGGWFYGFYDETADPDHVYDANADFNNSDANWSLLGGSWQLGAPGDPGANPPWDTIGQTDWHPNGDNQAQGVHWMIKRWVSDVDGDMYAKVQFGKANLGGGNGVTLRVLRNGVQAFASTIAFNNAGIETNIALAGVFIGDRIDFALDPLGTDGAKGDGADGSFIRASIVAGQPPTPPRPFVPGIADCFKTDIRSAMRGVNPSLYVRFPFNVSDPASIETLKLKLKYNDGLVAYLNGKEILKRNAPTAIAGSVVADSVADWSTNPDVTVNGWSYGYYDQTLDSDHTYSGGADLTPFPHDGLGNSSTDFWTGSGYDWFAGNPPWTELFQEVTHPNHPNGGVEDPANPGTHQQWTVRRWTATVDANLKCRVRFRKTNPNCGDGVRLMVVHNSTQVYSQTIAFNDAVGRDDTVELPDVFLGDTVDIMLGPGDGNDSCDGSAFSAVIFEGEPSIPWNGVATAGRTTADTITAETFDLAAFKSELNAGANLLAIQGFNRDINDNEFLINAELLANRVPTAVADVVSATPDTAATFPAATLLANDTDPDGDQLLLVGVTPSFRTTQGGAVRLFGSTVVYTPPAGFAGADTFQYTVTDSSGTPARATVTVNVAAVTVNNAPSFTLSGALITENSAAPRTVAGWAGNISPGPAAFEAGQVVTFLVENDGSGLFDAQPAISSAGVLTFAAKTGSSGDVRVTVVAKDDGGTTNGGVDRSAAQVFTIRLNVPSACPTANAQSVTVTAGTAKAIGLTGNVATGAAFTIGTGPAHGSLSGTPPALIYTPAAGYCGPDSFTFSVSLAGCPTSSATVTLNIECGTNSCPVAIADVGPGVDVFLCGAETVIIAGDYSATGTRCEDGLARVELDGRDSRDTDGNSLTFAWFTVQEDGTVSPLATGAQTNVVLEPGMYTIRLVVDDGQCLDTMDVDIHIITPAEGIDALIEDIKGAGLGSRNRRPLISLLKSASACFDRCLCDSGVRQLNAFINKVRAQILTEKPELAATLIEKAQALLDSVDCGQP